MRQIFVLLLFTLPVLLTACAPTLNAGNKNSVSINVIHSSQEGEALSLADAHCAKYGLSAKLRHPRNSDSFGKIYDYSCVK